MTNYSEPHCSDCGDKCFNGGLVRRGNVWKCEDCWAKPPTMTTPVHIHIEKVKPFTCDFIRRHTDTEGNAERIIQSLDECYEEGVKAEATRRDGIEHAIEQSIIDQHITNERNRITQWAMEVLPFYPEAQKALIEFLADNK